MKHTKDHPYLATIKEKVNLCGPESQKETHHIVLSLSGSDFYYEVGDCVAVYPTHSPALLEKTLQALKMHGGEQIVDVRTGKTYLLKEFLTHKACLSDLNKKLVYEMAKLHPDEEKKASLMKLLEPENRQLLSEYVEARRLCDLLGEHPEVSFTPQEICSLLKPLLPRFYSIASSLKAVKDEVHLTVKKQVYKSQDGHRYGTCSYYLCDVVDLNQPVVPIYIHPHRGFTLPEDPATPIIMIGPGTGIAPFRGFMQERIATNAPGKNWLFFGDWSRKSEFLYGDYWMELEKEGKLILDLAFSRDQQEKVYVQHRMLEKGAELYAWLQQGACLYVCGDAKRMAKDVENALLTIFQQCGHPEPKEYLRTLRRERRYLRDVY